MDLPQLEAAYLAHLVDHRQPPRWQQQVLSTKFLVAVLTILATVGTTIQGALPPQWAAIVLTATQATYAVVRTIENLRSSPS